jgi:hypothetical protein
MTDWTYGQDDEAAMIHDLIDDKEFGREIDPEDDFERYYTLGGDPLCVDCAMCLHENARYKEIDFDEPVGTCYECGGAL